MPAARRGGAGPKRRKRNVWDDDQADAAHEEEAAETPGVPPDGSEARAFIAASVVQQLYDVNALAGILATLSYNDTVDDDFSMACLLQATLFCRIVADDFTKLCLLRERWPWLNLSYYVLAEGLQAYVFLVGCSFRHKARVWVPSLMAVQVALLRFQQYLESSSTGHELEKEEAMQRWRKWRASTKSSDELPKFLLLNFFFSFQPQAPFSRPKFRERLAIYLWHSCGIFKHRLRVESSSVVRKRTWLWVLESWQSVVSLAFGAYMYSLAVTWWYSPDIESLFDKVAMWFIVVPGGCVGIGLLVHESEMLIRHGHF